MRKKAKEVKVVQGDWYPGCVNDQLWRLNHMYFILDKQGATRRFKLNWAQEQIYKNRWNRNAILKARQLGMSTFTSILMLDMCIHYPNFKAGIIDKSLPDGEEKLAKIKFAAQCMLNAPEFVKDEFVTDAEAREAIAMHNQAMISQMLVRSQEGGEGKIDKTILAQKAEFANGSKIVLGTSLRGGTLQFLHVSEFGSIAANNPSKALEILSGGVNAVPADGLVIIESTHEGGKYGENYRIMKNAMEMSGKRLTQIDYRFFFFPWWKQAEYALPGEGHAEYLDEYFESLEAQGISLSPGQKKWYSIQEKTFGYRVKTEYPSTPEEAFTQQVDGSLYGSIISRLRYQGRMAADFEADPYAPLYVSWDIGMSDYTSMWIVQPVAGRFHVLDYYCANDHDVPHYINKVLEWEAFFGKRVVRHLLPHDAKVERDWGNPMSSFQMKLISAGFNTVVLPKTSNVWDGIFTVKDLLPHFTFHKRCSEPIVVDGKEYMSGVDALENYQSGRLGANGVERTTPLHDLTSHGADAFRYFVEGYTAGLVLKDAPEGGNGAFYVRRDSEEAIVCKGVPALWSKKRGVCSNAHRKSKVKW